MKLLTILLTILTLSLTVQAKEIVINASHVADNNGQFPLTMPCDWDGELANTTLFGYYGESNTQFTITPVSLGKFGPSGILIHLPMDIMENNGQPLNNITVEYPETKARCKTGFGMDQLTK